MELISLNVLASLVSTLEIVCQYVIRANIYLRVIELLTPFPKN